MDMPPSGWYPDPRGTPELLRWWDGATWTDHTHTEYGAGHAGAPQPGHDAPLTRAEPGMALTVMEPPAGPRTEPQPAVPEGQAGNHTAVLSVDPAAWSDGSAWGNAPGGQYGVRDRTPRGFLSDPRHHRTIVTTGLAAGVVIALVTIVSVVVGMRSSARPAPAPAPSTAAAAPAASGSASPSATPSPSLAMLSDSKSGLSYGQLSSPWSPTCPASLNSTPQVFTWSAGESATAGQVIPAGAAPVTWYGEACSGPLPAQYGYHTTADLANTANALANAFNAAYYMALPHSFQQAASQPITVSGHPGWEIKYTETYTSPAPGMSWSNESAAVVVVDPQNGAAPSVFFASVPANLNEATVDTLVQSLQFNPPPGATPTAGTPMTPAAPAPGQPAPGQGGGPGPGGGNQQLRVHREAQVHPAVRRVEPA